MYKIEKFEVREPQVLASVISRYPFATVTSVAGGKPFVNHLPIIAEELPGGKVQLLGHMSRRNPQWEHFKAGSTVVIAFHGPHTYVHPGWYVENDVPTWNYIAVHASGSMNLVEDYSGIINILKQTTLQMNQAYKDKWDFYMPSDLEAETDLTSAIIGFRMIPDELVGKFKLNQNRSRADQVGVIEGLRGRQDEGSLGIAEWMAKLTD